MTKFIAEFMLDSDIRLNDDQDSLHWASDDPYFEIELFSASKVFSYISESLKAHLTFEAADIFEAKEICQDLLASILNSLVWASVSMIRQARLTRIVDWSRGKTMRDSIFFNHSPKIATTIPILSEELLGAAMSLYRSQAAESVQSALRWFRLGISGENIDEQFTYFWFSLETAAEALKSAGKVPSKCPVCESDLFCKNCGTAPLHRRFSADAIRDLILGAFTDGDEGITTFKALMKIRHTLMHGRRLHSIETRLPISSEEATNRLAQIARNAILKMSDFSKYPDKDLDLSIVQSNDLLRGTVVASAHVQTVFGPDPDNPELGANKGITITTKYPGQPDGD